MEDVSHLAPFVSVALPLATAVLQISGFLLLDFPLPDFSSSIGPSNWLKAVAFGVVYFHTGKQRRCGERFKWGTALSISSVSAFLAGPLTYDVSQPGPVHIVFLPWVHLTPHPLIWLTLPNLSGSSSDFLWSWKMGGINDMGSGFDIFSLWPLACQFNALTKNFLFVKWYSNGNFRRRYLCNCVR